MFAEITPTPSLARTTLRARASLLRGSRTMTPLRLLRLLRQTMRRRRTWKSLRLRKGWLLTWRETTPRTVRGSNPLLWPRTIRLLPFGWLPTDRIPAPPQPPRRAPPRRWRHWAATKSLPPWSMVDVPPIHKSCLAVPGQRTPAGISGPDSWEVKATRCLQAQTADGTSEEVLSASSVTIRLLLLLRGGGTGMGWARASRDTTEETFLCTTKFSSLRSRANLNLE